MDNLTVLTKWEDLAGYAYIAIKSYPKSERHTLAAQTVNALLDTGAAKKRLKSISKRYPARESFEEARKILVSFLGYIRFCSGAKITESVLKRAAYCPKGDKNDRTFRDH